MGAPDKMRRRDRQATAKEWTGKEKPAVRPETAEPAETGDDAISGLLGTPSSSTSRLRQVWRWARWVLAAVLLLGFATPGFLWVRYQSQHVTSKNAAVRGHLAEIGTRLTGLVTKVEVDVGDRVVAGQILVRLEDRHLLAEVQEARAEVQGLQRTIEVERLNIAHESRRIEQQEREAAARIAAAEAQTEAARIRADDARRDYEMHESLFSRDGVVSGEDVRDAQTEQRTAAALLEEARANSAVARSAGQSVRLSADAIAIKDREVGVLEADLLRAQARLTRAEADLDGASIRAPEDGAIVRRIVQPGGSVEAGQPIISMWLGSEVWVEAWIDEDDIGSVRLGSVATVTFHSFPGREFTGVVDKVGLATDLEIPDSEVPQPRFSRMRSAPVVGVRIRLDDAPLDLLPGLSAVVAIRKAE
jgi:membrane fusion protein (multidrug efflux system)